jgi:Phosphotransferase enzyme family
MIEPDGTTIEKRLPGRPMADMLSNLEGERRRTALASYFEAATAIRGVAMPDHFYGQLLVAEPIVASEWTAFLSASLDRYLARYRRPIEAAFGDAETLVGKARALMAAVPAQPEKVLAHGDFFPGNVLIDDRLKVTAVVDFGTWTLVAEPLYDIAGAVMFAEVATECGPDDWAYLRSLMLQHCGETALAAMTFYRAYFALALFDPAETGGLYPKLHPWMVATLRQLADGTLGAWATTGR